jgi:hypothetical protein
MKSGRSKSPPGCTRDEHQGHVVRATCGIAERQDVGGDAFDERGRRNLAMGIKKTFKPVFAVLLFCFVEGFRDPIGEEQQPVPGFHAYLARFIHRTGKETPHDRCRRQTLKRLAGPNQERRVVPRIDIGQLPTCEFQFAVKQGDQPAQRDVGAEVLVEAGDQFGAAQSDG